VSVLRGSREIAFEKTWHKKKTTRRPSSLLLEGEREARTRFTPGLTTGGELEGKAGTKAGVFSP